MKITLISDGHGEEGIYRQVFLREQDSDLFLCLGDSELPPEAIAPFYGVRGNCDRAFPYKLKDMVDTPAGLLFYRHYPPSGEGMLDDMFSLGIRIFAHGHTHIRRFERIGGIYVVCPGSAAYPRDGLAPGYCVLDVKGPGEVEATFKDI